MIASQIPQHTLVSLAKVDVALTMVFGQELNAAQIHMVAACVDEHAGQIASVGIEILYMDSGQRNRESKTIIFSNSYVQLLTLPSKFQ